MSCTQRYLLFLGGINFIAPGFSLTDGVLMASISNFNFFSEGETVLGGDGLFREEGRLDGTAAVVAVSVDPGFFKVLREGGGGACSFKP